MASNEPGVAMCVCVCVCVECPVCNGNRGLHRYRGVNEAKDNRVGHREVCVCVCVCVCVFVSVCVQWWSLLRVCYKIEESK